MVDNPFSPTLEPCDFFYWNVQVWTNESIRFDQQRFEANKSSSWPLKLKKPTSVFDPSNRTKCTKFQSWKMSFLFFQRREMSSCTTVLPNSSWRSGAKPDSWRVSTLGLVRVRKIIDGYSPRLTSFLSFSLRFYPETVPWDSLLFVIEMVDLQQRKHQFQTETMFLI